MYTCHLTVYRQSLVKSLGGFRVGFEGSQDHDLMLRCSENTQLIHHIPKVLYHWRTHAESTASGLGCNVKDYCVDAGSKALKDTLKRRHIPATVDIVGKKQAAYWVKPSVIKEPTVDIIIPSFNGADILETCLASIFEKTTYPHFTITVIDNNSYESDFFALIAYWEEQEPTRFQVIRDERPFNFSSINNSAVEKTSGDYLLFLNNDTEVITPDWLEGMLGYSQLEDVGAVGVKLLYPDDTVQHAGVVMGIGGIAGHAMKNFPRQAHGYFSHLELVTNYTAVTAACLMIKREKFNAAGGFDEHLQIAFNDIDFCLKVRQQSLFNVYLPFVELYHHESKSRGYENTPEKQARFEKEVLFMRQRWGNLLDNDPFYSPWLSLSTEDISYRFH
jgi:GT2 family glycosyltransferase